MFFVIYISLQITRRRGLAVKKKEEIVSRYLVPWLDQIISLPCLYQFMVIYTRKMKKELGWAGWAGSDKFK